MTGTFTRLLCKWESKGTEEGIELNKIDKIKKGKQEDVLEEGREAWSRQNKIDAPKRWGGIVEYYVSFAYVINSCGMLH